MLTSPSLKRFRSVIVALTITIGTNYAISYAARNITQTPSSRSIESSALESRSGTPIPPPTDIPRPSVQIHGEK